MFSLTFFAAAVPSVLDAAPPSYDLRMDLGLAATELREFIPKSWTEDRYCYNADSSFLLLLLLWIGSSRLSFG